MTKFPRVKELLTLFPKWEFEDAELVGNRVLVTFSKLYQIEERIPLNCKCHNQQVEQVYKFTYIKISYPAKEYVEEQ